MVIISISKAFIKINNNFRQEDIFSFETKERILKNKCLIFFSIIIDVFENASWCSRVDAVIYLVVFFYIINSHIYVYVTRTLLLSESDDRIHI